MGAFGRTTPWPPAVFSGGWHVSVKWQEWESGLQSLRPYSQGFVMRRYLKRRTASTLVLVLELGKNEAGDQQEDWCSICRNAHAVLFWCGKERAETNSNTLSFPADPCSYTHLCSWTVGSDQKNEFMDAGWNDFHHRVGELSLRGRLRRSGSRVTAPQQ